MGINSMSNWHWYGFASCNLHYQCQLRVLLFTYCTLNCAINC